MKSKIIAKKTAISYWSFTTHIFWKWFHQMNINSLASLTMLVLFLKRWARNILCICLVKLPKSWWKEIHVLSQSPFQHKPLLIRHQSDDFGNNLVNKFVSEIWLIIHSGLAMYNQLSAAIVYRYFRGPNFAMFFKKLVFWIMQSLDYKW